jgi:hypothetical protein
MPHEQFSQNENLSFHIILLLRSLPPVVRQLGMRIKVVNDAGDSKIRGFIAIARRFRHCMRALVLLACLRISPQGKRATAQAALLAKRNFLSSLSHYYCRGM